MTDELRPTFTREQLQRAGAVQFIMTIGGQFQASEASSLMSLADYIVRGFEDDEPEEDRTIAQIVIDSIENAGLEVQEWQRDFIRRAFSEGDTDKQDTPAETPALISPRTHREPPTGVVLVDKDGDTLARKTGQDGWFYPWHGTAGHKWSERELRFGPYQLKWANGGQPAREVAHQLSKWSSGVDPEPDRSATLVDESGAHWAHGPYGWQKDRRAGGFLLQPMGWGDTRLRAHTFTILDPEANK